MAVGETPRRSIKCYTESSLVTKHVVVMMSKARQRSTRREDGDLRETHRRIDEMKKILKHLP